LPELERLWRLFEEEVPPPAYVDVDAAQELREIAELVSDGIALVAETGDGVVGFVLARAMSAQAGSRAGQITDLYVEPAARRDGVARALVHEAAARLAGTGVEHVELDVEASNDGARAVYARWGFREQRLVLVSPVDALVARLDPTSEGPTFGVVFVQTDDQNAVERAASSFAPRIGSSGVDVDSPVDGWIAVRDHVATHDPDALRRLTKELSDRLGSVVVSIGIESGAVVRMVAMERGSILDEYLSVPEFHGPLPPGDVVALAANPTVLHRLTGADPSRVRAVIRTATSPTDLPSAPELAASIAAVLGLPPLDR
jgi:ribosomal protein S18 acetylase RimI-like enzyme